MQQQASALHLSQHKYISDLLTQTSMLDSKPAATPGSQGPPLSTTDGDPLQDVTMYRSTMGALQYATLIRPNITFALNKACQFMSTPTTSHWVFVKRILCYLKDTLSHGILLQPSSSLAFQGYIDADWPSCPNDRRSTSGYCVYLGSSLVTWSSSKQLVVSRSSAKSE